MRTWPSVAREDRAAPLEPHAPEHSAGRPPAARYKRRWTLERTTAWFQNFRRRFIRYEKSTMLFLGFLHLGCAIILLEQVLDSPSSPPRIPVR
jgi:hypothetical protein